MLINRCLRQVVGTALPKTVSGRKAAAQHTNKKQCLVNRYVRQVVGTVWPKIVSSRKAALLHANK